MKTTSTLNHPALIARDVVRGERVTLVGAAKKTYIPTHTVLRKDLEANPNIDRKGAWGLPAAPVAEFTLNPDNCDNWAAINSVARKLGIRVATKERYSQLAWSRQLTSALFKSGYTFKHGVPAFALEKRRGIVISNKCFALRNAGKWLVKDTALFWGGFDYCFLSDTYTTPEAAQQEADRLNNLARRPNYDVHQHSFTVVRGGNSKAFA
jgi:hypothetical protein